MEDIMDKEKQSAEKPPLLSEQNNDRTTNLVPIPLWKPSISVGSANDSDQEMIIEEEKKSNQKLVSSAFKKGDSGSPLAVTKQMSNSKSEITSEAFKQNMSVDEYAQQQFFPRQVKDDTIRLSPNPEQDRKTAIAVCLGETLTRQNILFGFGLVSEFVGIGLGIHFMLKTNTFKLGLALTCAFGVLFCLTILFRVCPPFCLSENQRREVAIQRIDTTYQPDEDDLTNQKSIMNNVTSK
jgi:hypothetical protein